MKTQMRTAAGRGRRGPHAGEGGFLLVMVMVVMLVLSTIAASTLINSFLERSLAKNQNYASIALQAADGGACGGDELDPRERERPDEAPQRRAVGRHRRLAEDADPHPR